MFSIVPFRNRLDWTMTDSFSDIFDDSFNYPLTTVDESVDEEDKKYTILIDMPGVKKADIKITLNKGVLTAGGERKDKRSNNKYKRSWRLPDDADPNSVTASYSEGVLAIDIKKKKESEAKEIRVT